ncbi:hypothetical protein FA15DRAFT_641296 [Coprinopsis marcescibilis]|uniref:F-box domain-containing protein n=1 Tax=Coprinopsis marcescibilis TaxID=230819 RepID=A0A5C3KUL9_COPMA|nr:hypothetical protein FA15DRAFT_641296 [Coprinopsis marcescibilis]
MSGYLHRPPPPSHMAAPSLSFLNDRKVADLLDLPDELLLLILDRPAIVNKDLHALCQASRRLHDICLTICFTRFGIKNPQKQVKIVLTEDPHHTDPIPFLRISLSVTSIERLVLKFPACDSNICGLIRCVNRTSSLVKKLESVTKVILLFSNDTCYCCSNTYRIDQGTVQEWSNSMGVLMNTILERSCSSLVLKGGRCLGHLFAFRRIRPGSSKLINPIEAVKTFFSSSKSGDVVEDVKRMPKVTKGENWEFKRAHNISLVLTNLSPAAQSNNKLKNLTIQSMMFLTPPLLQWTISAARFSELEQLHLANLSINHKCWPAIFDLLSNAAPDLTELSFSKVRQLDPPDLLKFVGTFPRLTSLTLNREVDSLDSFNAGHFPDFPNLMTLHAPANWVFKLLSAQQRGLESLENLCITYKLRNEGFSHWLRPFPSPSIPSLLRDHLRPLMLCLEVRLGDSPAWRMFEDMNAVPSSNPDNSCLDLINSITLLIEEEFVKTDMPLLTILPRWLSIFPALRLLTVTGHNSYIEANDMFESIIDIVKAKKLHLQHLEVNGKEAEFVRNSSKTET